MKKIIYSFIIVLMLVLSVKAVSNSDYLSDIQIKNNISTMPLSFTKNQGQWDENLKFRANASGATMWFASDGAYFQFSRTIKLTPMADVTLNSLQAVSGVEGHHQVDSIETMMIKANYVGSNTHPVIRGLEEIDYKCNYFIGNDKSKWATNVPNYSAVMYEEIYNGIDLKYYGNGKQMEYDFIVAPGADFSQIKIQYEGAESIAVNDDGELVVTTMWGEVVEQRPVIYQVENNNRIQIDGSYKLQSDNSFSFELRDYNKELPLVIDPILTYSTYLGGTDNDLAYAVAVDDSGAVYITGSTESTDFPTFNPYQTDQSWGDVFITKLNNTGNALLYSTYVGGSAGTGTEGAFGIAVDSLSNVYVTGSTGSTDFPLVNPFQNVYGGSFNDAFIIKLNSSGDTLLYSTYLGGLSNDFGEDIAVDNNGCAYITGRTNSTNYPTQNAFQNSFGGNYDAFVTKLSAVGNTVLYSTYLGGTDWEHGLGITIDSNYSAYLTGTTASPNFTTLNAYQSTIGGGKDAFVSIFDSTGTTLIYSSYFGGLGDDVGYAITRDDSNIYISGQTSSANFPTLSAYQNTYGGGGDAFVSKFNNNGNILLYSTYLGGTLDDYSNGIAIDSIGLAYITGSTRSTDFPIQQDASQITNGGNYDAFLSMLDNTGSSLLKSTYLGGADWDHGYGIALYNNYTQYIAGYTWSSDLPTVSPYQATFGGMIDAFVAKFDIIVLDVEEFDVDNLPSSFNMSQNYPNPFNPTTTIEFNLPTKSNVIITIYNLLGQEVQQLIGKQLSAGNFSVTWDGTSSNGIEVSTGIYLYRIETDNFVETKKMLLLK